MNSKNISLDSKYLQAAISPAEIEKIRVPAKLAYDTLMGKTGAGNGFLDWLDLPLNIDEAEIEDILKTAAEIREKSEILVCIGIGGSYLGAKAVYDALTPDFSLLSGTKLIFAGNNLSPDYLSSLRAYLKDRDYHINVISKSGTTTEPALAFRVLLSDLRQKYGDAASERIIATTDPEKGALRNMADKESWKSFKVPAAVGGRYSVLTAVGLLPIAAAGIDIKALLNGAKIIRQSLSEFDFDSPVIRYAVNRRIMYDKGFRTEVIAAYEPKLRFFLEWWKQLYGESEGKDGKGILPSSVLFTDDLHSLGQFIQEGSRNLLWLTHLMVEKPDKDIEVPSSDYGNLDGLDYLLGKKMSYIRNQAMLGTAMAHADGGTPSSCIKVPELKAETLGSLIFFFEFACGLSAYMSCVNPFDQPGVESYKNNMFALLGKPSHAELSEKLRKD